MTVGTGVSIVVPTIGRTSLSTLLDALAGQVDRHAPVEVIVVHDRPSARPSPPAAIASVTRVVRGAGAGPAAARNTGWRLARYPWVVFLDDDVVPAPGWWSALLRDVDVSPAVVGVQGRIEVPLPTDRRPTDWERVTAGLAGARWITADMAYRRDALAAAGGFDERFPRAFREDAELAYRLRNAGGVLLAGARRTIHPVREEDGWASLRSQRGNADDALLRRLYGPHWRRLLEIPPGRRYRHALIAAAGLAALLAAGTRPLLGRLVERPPGRDRGRARRSSGRRSGDGHRERAVASWLARVGWLAGAGWLAGTAEFAVARIAPGPRTGREITRMATTSVVIPPAAVAYWLIGWWRSRDASRRPPDGPGRTPASAWPRADAGFCCRRDGP